MLFQLTCLLPLLRLLHAQVKNEDHPRLNPMMRAVQDFYLKRNLTVMLNVNNEMTVVKINLKNGSGSHSSYYNMDDDIGYYFYSRKNQGSPVKYSVSNIKTLVKNEQFNVSEKTVILVHGFLNNLSSPMIQLPTKALLKYHYVNVIAVDWYQVMAKQKNDYVECALDTWLVGRKVGRAVSELISGGVHRSKIHLVGHSLGAHVVGVAGRYLKELNQTIARISGLDPAKVAFEESTVDHIIDAEDADYVDCIHSCGSYLGFDRPLCQTDFYPNGGFLQPGCSFFGDICCVCSHGRSYHYFAESIMQNHTFPASHCTWTSEGLLGCTDVPQMMGYTAKSQYKGSYYVKTESDYPFSPNIKRPEKPGFWAKIKVWLKKIQFIIASFF